MEKKYTVYMHITPSGKRYIGITCRKPEYRWNHGDGYAQNKHFYNAILKYGWENIEHKIIVDGLSKEDACEMEQILIKRYDSTNPLKGYNNSIGGESGSLGVVFTEERKKKIGESHKGMKHTPDAKRRISAGHLGKPTWNKGRSWTEDEKERFCSAQKSRKPVRCIETGIEYLGIRDAERQTGINRCSIKDCCRKRQNHKTAGGYHWEYAVNERRLADGEIHGLAV